MFEAQLSQWWVTAVLAGGSRRVVSAERRGMWRRRLGRLHSQHGLSVCIWLSIRTGKLFDTYRSISVALILIRSGENFWTHHHLRMHGICPELLLTTSKAAWSSVLMPVYGIHFTVTHCKFHVTCRLPDIILYRTTSLLGTALCCVMVVQYGTIHNSTLPYSTGTAHSTTAHLERIDCFLWLSVYFIQYVYCDRWQSSGC